VRWSEGHDITFAGNGFGAEQAAVDIFVAVSSRVVVGFLVEEAVNEKYIPSSLGSKACGCWCSFTAL
jgi:hypothetical protein